MRILINASNLKVGGGLQVADSLFKQLDRFHEDIFFVVLSSKLSYLSQSDSPSNVHPYIYDIRNSVSTLLLGRDAFLDQLVNREHIDAVLTIFGPSRWEPRVPHLCGFARLHLVFPESPYFTEKPRSIKERLSLFAIRGLFARGTTQLYSENSFVSDRVEKLFRGKRCYTVTNYYNQVFDEPHNWNSYDLPSFDGVTILNIGANYPHKNLSICKEVARILVHKYPKFKFRFVLTVNQEQYSLTSDLEPYFLLIGPIHISNCPSLYSQADVMFQPTLLECFTATYPEAMRMRVPIVTTDLEFAKGLCDDAAEYFLPLNPEDAADKIYRVATNKQVASRLVNNGERRLKEFDSYCKRADKLISIVKGL